MYLFFISLIFNFPKVLRIFGETDLAPNYPWDFNLYELIFQILFQILFCYLLGYIALKRIQNNLSNNLFEIKLILSLIVMTFVFWFIGSNLQEIIFKNVSNQKFFLQNLSNKIYTKFNFNVYNIKTFTTT